MSGSDESKRIKRDRDLLGTDGIMTHDYLDGLWDWFNSALERNVDRDFIFVKLVNAVRNPYIDQHQNHTNIQHRQLIPTYGGALYTPGECTVAEDTAEGSLSESQSVMKALTKEVGGLKLEIHGASVNITKEFDVLQAKLKELPTVLLSPTPSISPQLHPNRIGIRSAHRTGAFIQVNGEGVSKYQPGGGGKVAIQKHLCEHETLEVEYYPDNTVAFKSTYFHNVYLRAHCTDRHLSPGVRVDGGGGVVNCQYISTDEPAHGVDQKFRIHPLEWQGAVAIEPVASPGRYLSIDNKTNKVTLQGKCEAEETLYLMFVWW